MTISDGSDKKVSQSDRWVSLLGKIVAAIRNDGFSFSARLIELRDDECWFESKNGVSFMVRRSKINEIREIIPRRA
jgi:hypothetical protein